MNAKYEKKTLGQVIKLLDQPERRRRHARFFSFSLYAISAVFIIGAFLLVSRGVLSGTWGVVVGAFGGVSTGVASYLGTATKQWPVVSAHINRESIVKRLTELET